MATAKKGGDGDEGGGAADGDSDGTLGEQRAGAKKPVRGSPPS